MSPDQGGRDRRRRNVADAGNDPVEPIVVALLGEVALRRDGVLSAVPGSRAGLLLAALALRPGRSRSARALIDEVWGERPPRAPMNALHTQVSRLRAVLPEGALEIGPGGYRLLLDARRVDLGLVGALVTRARRALDGGDVVTTLDVVESARSVWRGEPGAGLAPGTVADAVHAEARALWSALDDLELAARQQAGDIDGALALARRRAAADPFGDAAQSTLMSLLARSGRAAEALESFAAFRSRLAERLGADPGPALVALNTAILRGELGAPVRAEGSGVTSGERPGTAGGANGSGRAVPNGGAPGERPETGAEASPDADARGSADTAVGEGDREADEDRAPGGVPAAIGLRAAPNALLGRDDDLAALTMLLREARVVTVLGPGGAGKTRIAHAVGARMAGRIQVVMVELASLRAGPGAARIEVEAAIAAALGVGEVAFDTVPASRARRAGYPAGQRLRDAVAARPLLLVLDNCEHLVEAVAVVVADLVSAADRLTVLTTSRAPLMIGAEAVYPLPPLTVDATGSPATDLFAARARAVRPSVRLDPEIVARLCRTLDGLPLAIELAAARVRTMSVEEIRDGLADRFALLRGGDRSSPERHRTLHAVIEWSWNLLDEPQRVVLRRLCRFPAGFGAEAAATVAGGPEVGDLRDALDGLVNQSLLTVVDDETTGIRYRMLETVREFGEERLIASGDAELVAARTLRWARDFAEVVAADHTTGDQMRAALLVTAELDNLLTALRLALDRGDAATAYTVFPVVGALWMIRGSHAEVLVWVSRVIALDETSCEGSAPRADLVVVTFQMALMHLVYTDEGIRHLARLRVRLRRLLRDRADLGSTARFVGTLALVGLDGAGMARQLAVAIVRGDPESAATALLLRANIRENDGDVRGSTRDAVRALAVFGHSHIWSVAMVCRHLGQVFGQIARYADSVTYYRRALDLQLRLGVFEDSVEIRAMLAASLIGAGEFDQARRELEFVAGGELEPGAGGWEFRNQILAGVMQARAELALAQGDIGEGLRGYERALRLCGWPAIGPGPGPGALMGAAAALDARVLYGEPTTGALLARQIVEAGLRMIAQYPDLPQVGGMCCAVGSYLVASRRDPGTGLRLLAAAPVLSARQDFPSMRLDRHLAVARRVLGDPAVDRALAETAGLGRRTVAAAALALLAEVSAAL